MPPGLAGNLQFIDEGTEAGVKQLEVIGLVGHRPEGRTWIGLILQNGLQPVSVGWHGALMTFTPRCYKAQEEWSHMTYVRDCKQITDCRSGQGR